MAAACGTAQAAGFPLIPLNDLGPLPYRLGFIGGLWENGSNVIPPDHLAAGIALAKQIEPLDENGRPSASGKIALITVGDGDTDRVICSSSPTLPCEPGSFTNMLKSSPHVNPALVVVNAAYLDFREGLGVDVTTAPVYDRIARELLQPAGLTPQQVQVAWIQMSKNHPSVDITCACSDTYNLKIDLAIALRGLRSHYPNLKIAYMSGRPFAGYDANPWNAEPFAYDSSIAVRIVLQDQLDEARSGFVTVDARVGPINYVKGEAPWAAWGPYLWANGTTPRSDGLTWQPEDYDGEFLSEKGAHKSAMLLVDFLTNDPTARMWFLAPGAGARTRAARH